MRGKNIRRLGFLCGILILSGGTTCIRGSEPPPLPAQAEIAYPNRIFVVDRFTPGVDLCKRLGNTDTSTGGPTIASADGIPEPVSVNVPFNCFVSVEPGSLRVDSVEVTNDLYQLCFDSGACAQAKGDTNPNDANVATVCNNEARFGDCPVVNVTQAEAQRFCAWIGRRLPSSLEHMLIRQAHFFDPGVSPSPLLLPVYPVSFPANCLEGAAVAGAAECRAPESCSEAVVSVGNTTNTSTRSVNCSPARPVLNESGEAVGGGELDVVDGNVSGRIFDLMGNVAEWSLDRELRNPADQGLEGYPWLCVEPLLPEDPEDPPPDRCPEGKSCLWGRWRPVPGEALRDRPVCVVNPTGTATVAEGVLSNGSVFGDHHLGHEQAPPPRTTLFGREQLSTNANERTTTNSINRAIGLRCVGDADAQTGNARLKVSNPP